MPTSSTSTVSSPVLIEKMGCFMMSTSPFRQACRSEGWTCSNKGQ